MKDHCIWDQFTPEWWSGPPPPPTCVGVADCTSYRSSASCGADAAKFGTCHWNVQKLQCENVDTCDNYGEESACLADALGAANRLYEGAHCWWRRAGLKVGSKPRGCRLCNSTTGNLEIRRRPYGGKYLILQLIDDGYDSYLTDYLGIGASFSDVPVSMVFDGDGAVVLNGSVGEPWWEIPTPLPDNFTVVYASCRGNFPERKDWYDDRYCSRSSGKAECDATA